MTDGKSTWGDTVLGWFVVRDKEQDSSYTLAATCLPSSRSASLPAAPGGLVDFDGGLNGVRHRARGPRPAGQGGRAPPLASGRTPTPPSRSRSSRRRSRRSACPSSRSSRPAREEIQALEVYIRWATAGDADAARRVAEADRRARGRRSRAIRKVMEEQVAGAAGGRPRPATSRSSRCRRCSSSSGRKRSARVVRESPKLHEPRAPGHERRSAMTTRAPPRSVKRRVHMRILVLARSELWKGFLSILDLRHREGASRDRVRERDQLDDREVHASSRRRRRRSSAGARRSTSALTSRPRRSWRR